MKNTNFETNKKAHDGATSGPLGENSPGPGCTCREFDSAVQGGGLDSGRFPAGASDTHSGLRSTGLHGCFPPAHFLDLLRQLAGLVLSQKEFPSLGGFFTFKINFLF